MALPIRKSPTASASALNPCAGISNIFIKSSMSILALKRRLNFGRAAENPWIEKNYPFGELVIVPQPALCSMVNTLMIRIAIVEDNETTREGLQTIINLSPEYQCVCACSTAEEALHALPTRQPQVVLMDIQLPGMSGIDCVAQIKRVLPDIQVIMVTVYEDPDRIFRALRAGASGYLLKRATPEQVLTAVRDVQHAGAL